MNQRVKKAQMSSEQHSPESTEGDPSMQGLVTSFKNFFSCLNDGATDSRSTPNTSSSSSGPTKYPSKGPRSNKFLPGRKRRKHDDRDEDGDESTSPEEIAQPLEQPDASVPALACFFVKSHPSICRGREYNCCGCAGYKRFPDLM
jgi:hypothetical protein